MSELESPELNYSEDVKVDKFGLDVEWENLPKLYTKWSEKLVDQENLKDRLKSRLELKYAELDIDIRTNPNNYGLGDSFPERVIKSTIFKNKDYNEIQEELLQTQRNIRVLKVAVKGIKDKGRAVDRLTKLYLKNYYVEGKEKGQEEVDATRQAQSALDASMRLISRKKKDGD